MDGSLAICTAASIVESTLQDGHLPLSLPHIRIIWHGRPSDPPEIFTFRNVRNISENVELTVEIHPLVLP